MSLPTSTVPRGGDLLHKLSTLAALATVFVFGIAGNAFAVANGAAVDGVTDATTTLKDTVVAAMPLILGVAVIIVVLTIAKRLVKKAG